MCHTEPTCWLYGCVHAVSSPPSLPDAQKHAWTPTSTHVHSTHAGNQHLQPNEHYSLPVTQLRQTQLQAHTHTHTCMSSHVQPPCCVCKQKLLVLHLKHEL
jgi:hypothetical protein